jgi:DNA-directed RNA polymerase subunit RPC12/RpoP
MARRIPQDARDGTRSLVSRPPPGYDGRNRKQEGHDMESPDKEPVSSSTFACMNCGADLKHQPGTTQLKCDSCGENNAIPASDEKIVELDFHAFLAQAEGASDSLALQTVKCEVCGATPSLEAHLQSAMCPYCASPLVIANAHTEKLIKPKALLPFKLEMSGALESFKTWVRKLWFAPGALKKAAYSLEQLKGVYIPYWTFDSRTESAYTGQRGDYYTTNETYQTTENGKSVTRTRQVRRIRWSYRSGRIGHFFDDLLVAATESLPAKKVQDLEPWDLENLVGFDEKFLSGYITEKYRVGLTQGFDLAKVRMDAFIRGLVGKDIGGDQQRIVSLRTGYSEITFKHVLLPIYLSAYRFNNKVYQFMVNGRTGEVQGDRPWSAAKTAIAIAAGLAIIGGIIAAIQYFN